MQEQLSFQEKYQILLDKNALYEGIFIAAVKTTGIFCRPTCPARKPKIANVVFYNTVEEALQHGFRPCKVCQPMNKAGETPGYIQDILQELINDPFLKIKDKDLRQREIEPNKIRRWFKKHHNLTFQEYQRLLRINMAYKKISEGSAVTNAAFDVGFESLSGFNSSYQNILGVSATQSKSKGIINIVRFTTPLGPMFGCATLKGVCLLEFTNRKKLEKEFQEITQKLNAVILPGDNVHLDHLQQEIAEYFAGQRQEFTVALDTPGTVFQNETWKALQQVPYGETRSYQQQACVLNKPKAVRAVAAANGCNRVAIVIPCHRIIGANGQLTGYGGGLERKRWLLNFEKAI